MLGLLITVSTLLPQSGAAADFGAEVRALLSAKCVDCHNPDSSSRKARREFDGMHDLSLVVDGLVTPGDPMDSDLWFSVEEGDMPPDDSDVPPLTGPELALIRTWIENGAPMPEDGDLVVPLPVQAEAPQDPDENGGPSEAAVQESDPGEREQMPFLDRLERFGARLHPLSTHFPVALLMVAAVARLLGGGRSQSRMRAAEGYCLLLGAIGAGAATGLGLLAEIHGSPEPDIADIHRWLAFCTSGAALVLVILRPFAVGTKVYGWLLILTAVAVGITGHYGGELAWGDDGPRLEILFPSLGQDAG